MKIMVVAYWGCLVPSSQLTYSVQCYVLRPLRCLITHLNGRWCLGFRFVIAAMGNPCIMGCESNEKSPAPHPRTGKVHTFRFPIKRHAHLLPKWERFVNRSKWNASSNTVLCHNHFDERFLNVSDESKRVHLDWASNPVPSIYVNEEFDKYTET